MPEEIHETDQLKGELMDETTKVTFAHLPAETEPMAPNELIETLIQAVVNDTGIAHGDATDYDHAARVMTYRSIRQGLMEISCSTPYRRDRFLHDLVAAFKVLVENETINGWRREAP